MWILIGFLDEEAGRISSEWSESLSEL